MSVSQKVLDAIELLTNSSIQKAGFDKTIQAQILSCEDATIGKYKCRYQDATFFAYTNNTDLNFNKGAYVYILVPNGDMSKDKTILGSTQKLGVNYISQAVGEQAYDINGQNLINPDNNGKAFYLNTDIKNYKYTIPLTNLGLDITKTNQNGNNRGIQEKFNQYIKTSSSIIIGATFKTSIKTENQYRGHYGITFNLKFIDNATNKPVIRPYTFNENHVNGNPYRMQHRTRQYQIFDIDNENFIEVDSVQIFCSDFPDAEIQSWSGLNETPPSPIGNGDIWDIEITNIELIAAIRMQQVQINGVSISFFTPQGTFFYDGDTPNSEKIITAQVRVKGKLVSESQNIPFYWGKQRVGINSNSQYYNKYLGRGWQCLNESNVVKEAVGSANPVIEWVPGIDTFKIKLTEATAKDNRFKVAIVYDGNVITKEINIQNLSTLNVNNLSIESNSGTKFYYDIGHPTLTCKVNGVEKITEQVSGVTYKYIYEWGYENRDNNFITLTSDDQFTIPVTIDGVTTNKTYSQLIDTLSNIKNSIAAGTKFANAQADNISTLQNAINNFNSIQRVKNNKLYDVQINEIDQFKIFKCSVFKGVSQGNSIVDEVYLGTASITLTNSLEGQGIYSLVINNGSATYQYNENGVAPNNDSLETKQDIKALSFTVYDNLGQQINTQELIKNRNNCKIRWEFPVKNTLLKDNNTGENNGFDETMSYIYYDNRTTLNYDIAQLYDVNKKDNQIKLIVDYKNIHLVATTNFTFVKQGEPGTNGTQYIVKIVPRTNMSNPPAYPIITKINNGGYILNYGVNSSISQFSIVQRNPYNLFKAQLWHGGQLVWEGVYPYNGSNNGAQALDGTTLPSLVTWRVLQNKYNNTIVDESAFIVNNEGYISYTGDHLASSLSTPLANIIECSITWQEKTYYGTIPITTAWVLNDNYRVRLKENTGFRYAIYTSDGVLPQYDSSHPFEFICQQRINNVWEDVSLVSGQYQVSYTITEVGNRLSAADGSIVRLHLLEILDDPIYRSGYQKNQWKIRPASTYDGICLNAAVCCTYTQTINGTPTVVGRINVPIHFLLNKFGLSHINDWDGNSVQIDEEGGFILAPQVGAGKKNSNNQFTGVLMGQVQQAGKSKSNVGLFGYDRGERTFFLNSENGSALFGKTSGGQIVIDPNNSKAMLYSRNYWKSSNYDDISGLPKNYNNSSKNDAGMLIDLSQPKIEFGSGKFSVNSNGEIYSTGGTIGKWHIGYSNLTSRAQGNTTGLTLAPDASGTEAAEGGYTGRIYSGDHAWLTSTSDGFSLSNKGLSIGGKFKATEKGVVTIGSGAVDGSSNYHWTINSDSSKAYIAFGTTNFYEAKDSTTAATNNRQVYLGTDGISIGRRFSVDNTGDLTAYKGHIGGWQIGDTALQASGIIIRSNGSIDGGIQNDSYNHWRIDGSGSAWFNNIHAEGYIDATSGYIGGWSISNGNLSAGNMHIYAEGSMSGPNWSINADGSAYFNNVISLNGSLGNGTLIGSGLSFGGGSSILSPDTIYSNGISQNPANNTLSKVLRGEFDTITARQAAIGVVNGEIVNVKGRLNAAEASIGTLNTTTANISGRLNAAEANIGSINTDIANIDSTLIIDGHYAGFNWVVSDITSFGIQYVEQSGYRPYLRIFLRYTQRPALSGDPYGGPVNPYEFFEESQVYLNQNGIFDT